MVYLKDEKTGVTVEDAGARAVEVPDMLYVRTEDYHGKLLHADEADALLRGLLRWKLETLAAEGRKPCAVTERLGSLVDSVIVEWERSR